MVTVGAKMRMNAMMNDRIVYELLYQFMLDEFLNHGEKHESVVEFPELMWDRFVESGFLYENMGEIKHLIRSIAKEIDRKDKLKCQYCRIDEGFLVEPPVKAEELCKKHRQEYEEQYVDRTLSQSHPGIINTFTGKEGLHCSAPPRKR